MASLFCLRLGRPQPLPGRPGHSLSDQMVFPRASEHIFWEAAGTARLPGEEGKQKAAGSHLGDRPRLGSWHMGGQPADPGLLPGHQGPNTLARPRNRWAGAWLHQPVPWGQRKAGQGSVMPRGNRWLGPGRGCGRAMHPEGLQVLVGTLLIILSCKKIISWGIFKNWGIIYQS